MPKTKRKVPSKFDELDLDAVRKLAEYGHTDDYMADFFNVSVGTWTTWKSKHPEFFKKLKGWKQTADDRVERALYEKALGYEWEEDAVVWDKFAKERVMVTLEKRLPPDTTACIFWLKNRRREQWRDKVEVDQNHRGSIQHDVRTDDTELDERIRLIAENAAENRVDQIDFGAKLEKALQ